MRVLATALGIACAFLGASCAVSPSAKDQKESGTIESARRMADGMLWTTDNLNIDTGQSYCYDDAELNCGRYGRLYPWESAQRGCQALGEGWRLPTNEEWAKMAAHYGGVRGDSADNGSAAYKALFMGGSAGFNALFGGNRSAAGQYERLNAHGLYWTASETGPATAWLYNFGLGGQALSRHSGGVKQIAVSVRCVRE